MLRPGLASASFALLLVAAGCGGGDDDDELTGLGQLCDPAMMGMDCPAEAPGCLQYTDTATKGTCSTLCVDGGTMTTNVQAQIATLSPDPGVSPQSTTCTGAFKGKVGAGSCAALLFTYLPAEYPPLANMSYTGVQIACVVQCGADNKCPGTLKCNTMVSRCEP
jgi:hypothetical protein